MPKSDTSGVRKLALVDRRTVASTEPAAITISSAGVICSCNDTAETMFGIASSELRQRHVSILLPSLADVEWFEQGQPNQRLSFLSHIGHRFSAIANDGTSFMVRLFINDLGNSSECTLRLIIRRIDENPDEHRTASRGRAKKPAALRMLHG